MIAARSALETRIYPRPIPLAPAIGVPPAAVGEVHDVSPVPTPAVLAAPYSPDFNPIEMAFACLKAMLRKAGERTVSGLWSLIGRLIDLFQPQECANYFSSCGYDPD